MRNIFRASVVGALALLCASVAAYSAILNDVQVRKTNGGPSGYNDVIESHEWTIPGVKKLHKLSCINPGYSSCAWVTEPSISAIPQAELLISAGTYNGHLEFTHPDGSYSEVDWTGTGPSDVLIYETVTPPGSFE